MSDPTLLQIIESTRLAITVLNSLSSPLCKQDELDNVERLLLQRSEDIESFFNQHSPLELGNMRDTIDQFLSQDKELTILADSIKRKMAKLLIKQKKNTKATNAYQNL